MASLHHRRQSAGVPRVGQARTRRRDEAAGCDARRGHVPREASFDRRGARSTTSGALHGRAQGHRQHWLPPSLPQGRPEAQAHSRDQQPSGHVSHRHLFGILRAYRQAWMVDEVARLRTGRRAGCVGADEGSDAQALTLPISHATSAVQSTSRPSKRTLSSTRSLPASSASCRSTSRSSSPAIASRE